MVPAYILGSVQGYSIGYSFGVKALKEEKIRFGRSGSKA